MAVSHLSGETALTPTFGTLPVISVLTWLLGLFGWVIVDSSVTNVLAKCVAVGVGTIINFFGAKYLFTA